VRARRLNGSLDMGVDPVWAINVRELRQARLTEA